LEFSELRLKQATEVARIARQHKDKGPNQRFR